MLEENVIDLRHLSKRFSSKWVLNDISLTIPRGRIVGILGLNGAGKTTLLQHIVGMQRADSGSCWVFKKHHYNLPQNVLNKIGYVDQSGSLLPWMGVRRLRRYIASFFPNWDFALEQQLIERFNIPEDGRVGRLSGGEKQKLAILLAVCRNPELLVLDEPAASLDPLARAEFLKFLLELNENRQRVILLSSHILEDVANVIDHVLVLRDGELSFNDSFDAFQESFGTAILTAAGNNLEADLKLPFPAQIEVWGRSARVSISKNQLPELETFADQHGFSLDYKGLALHDILKNFTLGGGLQ